MPPQARDGGAGDSEQGECCDGEDDGVKAGHGDAVLERKVVGRRVVNLWCPWNNFTQPFTSPKRDRRYFCNIGRRPEQIFSKDYASV